jgi:hypothetical protein
MRKLFIVLAKLIGLLQFYWALINIVQLGIALSQMSSFTSVTEIKLYWVGLLGTGIYFVLATGMAWVLVFRTTWLADRLNIRDEGETGAISEGAVYRTGLKLIGVYVTAYAIPALAKAVLTHSLFVSGLLTVDCWSRILPPVLQLAVGVFIVIKTDKLIAHIEMLEKCESRHILRLGFGVLAGMIVVGLAVTAIRSLEHHESYETSVSVINQKSFKEGTCFIHKETNAPSPTAMYDTPYWQEPKTEGRTETKVINLRL